MISLYPFQDKLVGQLRQAMAGGAKSVLLVSPTGSGKTVIFAYLASRMAERGICSIILAHRQELIDQPSAMLRQFNAPHGIIQAGKPVHYGHLIYVASVFAAVRRLKKLPVPGYVIVDEAHHCIEGSTWHKCIDYWRQQNPGLRVIGVTATASRLSGEGLGGTFEVMIEGPTTAQSIAEGYLSNYTLFRTGDVDSRGLPMRGGDYQRDVAEAFMDKPTITGDAISHYRKHLKGAASIVYTVGITQAHHVAEQFRQGGFNAVAIDGKMDKQDRRNIIHDFAGGRLNLLVSCDLISEGLDIPGAVGGILLRPTASESLYLQQVGRLLRVAPGKDRAIILDHVGNSFRHGLPCDVREWSLAGRGKRKKRDPDDIAVRQCRICGACSTATATICRECGHEFPVKPRVVKEVAGELTEVEIAAAKRAKKREQGTAKDMDALIEVGRLRGMKHPQQWAWYVLNARQKKRAKA